MAMTDTSVHTRFFLAASSIPVATSKLVHVILQDFHRLDADFSLIFRGLGGGVVDVGICNFIVSVTMSMRLQIHFKREIYQLDVAKDVP